MSRVCLTVQQLQSEQCALVQTNIDNLGEQVAVVFNMNFGRAMSFAFWLHDAVEIYFVSHSSRSEWPAPGLLR